ncbi:hypothetical protein [uncultured Rubinisphaera sp.]|uniref:DUF6896 domain-containing protein n=1 Tax=uncultured Rubinisphaera sp. TaxID=1678686 RepID=UPI0030DB22F0|tara:strand:+ start:3928 stop:4614 length:687 start_codon:yes stop_codon:yes gene_type:complete
MSDPLRIDCPAIIDIPNPMELSTLATIDHHVVLQFPKSLSTSDKQQLIAELSAALPEYSTFDSGGINDHECVTVMKVIGRDTVIANADAIIEAAHAFRDTATILCKLLANRKNVPPSELVERCSGSGRLYDGWKYAFHGLQCCFRHTKTKQVVDVEIAFGDEFGVLDPYFFGQFVTTTPKFKPLGKLFPRLYHDCRRSLDVLEELGHLVRIKTDTPFPKVGLVVQTGA